MSLHTQASVAYQTSVTNTGTFETPPNCTPLNTETISVQYAKDQPEENLKLTLAPTPREPLQPTPRMHSWVPIPLRPWFWIPFFSALVLIAIGLEIAFYFSNLNSGFATSGGYSVEAGVFHYVYTVPPSALAMIVVGIWAWIDVEIKRLQPYVDLVHGDSPPQRSLLLDYTRENKFLAWASAWSNGHFLVVITSLVVLMCLAFQPLASALFTVRDTSWDQPELIVNNLAAIGLNQGVEFTDLASFLTAAGFASASVLYNLTDPPFIHDAWTVGRFDMPSNIGLNGSFSVKTAAILSDPGCVAAPPVALTQPADKTGWVNTVTTYDGCYVSWTVDPNTTDLFGTDILQCGPTDDSAAARRPVIFWFFTYLPQVASKAVICTPAIYLYDVNVKLDLVTGNVLNITKLGNFTTGYSPFSSVSGNVTGAPLNGAAFNGIGFNLTNPTPAVLARAAAIRLQMPAAIFEYAERSFNKSNSIFTSDAIVAISARVYTTYLKLLAQTAYFLPLTEPLALNVIMVQKRLWLSALSVHFLAVLLIVIAILGTIVQLAHCEDRQHLHLAHQPGTIASAVSIGGQTHIGALLSGQQREEDIEAVMQNKRFRINPQTMKIVADDEPEYKEATSSNPERRKSIFRRG